MGDYEVFKKQIFTLTQIDLNAYKEKQMRRRIDSLITKHGITSYSDYVAAIKADRDKFEEFDNQSKDKKSTDAASDQDSSPTQEAASNTDESGEK